MRPALFSLAAAASLFAIGTYHETPASDPVIRPAVLTTTVEATRCDCLSGGECTCEQCLCGKVIEAPKPTITLAKATIPQGYVCGPSGCYPAASGTYSAGSCASGTCATAGGGERRGMFGRWYPGRRVVGLFRRRR